ncbi:hypothetical protein [Tsuneonella mangrovi]|uniref:hypothetical protein n=1 Tax=Tsuneonella mangrovi TaxID=1982042 RepID=UPI000BA21C7C|nr:hypothetical protein [Tsuneonella mangrovi]
MGQQVSIGGEEATNAAVYVIKAEDIAALNHLRPSHPRPVHLEWINRGTDQVLRPTTVEMLLRTLFRGEASPSVAKLHNSSGLRAYFISDQQRDQFARLFEVARQKQHLFSETIVTAMFDRQESAREAIEALKSAGVPAKSISIMWRVDDFIATGGEAYRGHSKRSVAAATAASGILGSILGVTTLAIEGIGPVAMAGPLLAVAVSQVSAVSGMIGATGGAIARMLSDHDVDGRDASFFESEIKRGRVFVGIDPEVVSREREELEDILRAHGGHFAARRPTVT